MKNRICSFLILLRLAFIILVGLDLYGQEENRVSVDIEEHGSIPPVSEWFACLRKLDGQPTYDPAQGDKCLKEILSHKYIKSGRIEFATSKVLSKLVIFVLESPSLKMTNIDYGIRKELKSEFQDYVMGNNLFPLLGDTYDYRDEGNNASRIGNFFESKGIMIGVSKRVDLDYRRGIASLTYRVWDGPDGPVRPLLSECDVRITYFSLLDLDDFTPQDLILKSTRTRDGLCYSESLTRTDEEILKNMKIFSDVHYSIDGVGSKRSISLHSRTNPLLVSDVSIDGYGLTSTGDIQKESSELPHLPLKASQVYHYSDAVVSRKLLEAYFKTDVVKARVFEDDELLPDSTLRVTYHVLTWPPDELYIDGRRLQ